MVKLPKYFDNYEKLLMSMAICMGLNKHNLKTTSVLKIWVVIMSVSNSPVFNLEKYCQTIAKSNTRLKHKNKHRAPNETILESVKQPELFMVSHFGEFFIGWSRPEF